ncbi:MAG: hypothetical protein HOY79_39080 [Streptomyces sp.]|nr:hypothetical protein [Streptomyces sp.]
MKDPVWKQADKAWSTCMRTAGYHHATPTDAQIGEDRQREELEAWLSARPQGPDAPSALEKQTATADDRCKQRTGYVRTVHAVDLRTQNQLIAKNRAKQRRWNRDAVRRAHDILEGRS